MKTKILSILSIIWEWIKKNNKFVLIGLMVLFFILFLDQCNRKNNIKDESEQNLYALSDTLHTVLTKNKKIETEKGLLVMSEAELKKAKKDLYDELQVEKGKVKVIIEEVIVIKHDTLYLHDTIVKLPNSNYLLKWDYNKTYDQYNYNIIAGESKIHIDTTVKPINVVSLGSTITKNEIGLNLITGIKKEDGKLKIFVRSDYPGFSVTKIDGCDLSESKDLKKYKRFGVGPNISIGVGTALKPEIFIGIGIQYNIFRF